MLNHVLNLIQDLRFQHLNRIINHETLNQVQGDKIVLTTQFRGEREKFLTEKRMVDEEILRLLKEHSIRFVSGEQISRQLKVTRTAIWKRVKRLRALGYEIEASTRT